MPFSKETKIRGRQLDYTDLSILLQSVTISDLREVDRQEYYDAVGTKDLTHFSTLLKLGLGMGDLRVEAFCFFLRKKPVFLATCHDNGVLCGFGWEKQDSLVSRRQRLQIRDSLHWWLILLNKGEYRCEYLKTNNDVRSGWCSLAKKYQGSYTIKIEESKQNPDYEQITLTRSRR